MKRNDILTLVVVAVVSGGFSWFLSSTFFSSAESLSQPVEVVDPISADFAKPSERYFNAQAINPAKLVEIGPNDNQNPFSSAQ